MLVSIGHHHKHEKMAHPHHVGTSCGRPKANVTVQAALEEIEIGFPKNVPFGSYVVSDNPYGTRLAARNGHFEMHIYI